MDSESLGAGATPRAAVDAAGGAGGYSSGLVYRQGVWPGNLSARKREASRTSGLPIIWDGAMPVRPAVSASRAISLTIKRAIDFTLSLAALIVLGPLLLFVALAIRLSSEGPVLFRQARVGLNGKIFTIYKFRSMYLDHCDLPGSIQAVEGDERVTPVGRFIRKTSIDELPQLLNVLFGEMSLVGPRPYVPDMLAGGKPYSEILPYFGMRYDMKPGLTGWAQANGFRGPTEDMDLAMRRVDHDIAYLQHFSLGLDAKIIARTLWRELAGGSGV